MYRAALLKGPRIQRNLKCVGSRREGTVSTFPRHKSKVRTQPTFERLTASRKTSTIAQQSIRTSKQLDFLVSFQVLEQLFKVILSSMTLWVTDYSDLDVLHAT